MFIPVLFILRDFGFPTTPCMHLNIVRMERKCTPSAQRTGRTHWIIESTEIEGLPEAPLQTDRNTYFCGRATYLRGTQTSTHRDSLTRMHTHTYLAIHLSMINTHMQGKNIKGSNPLQKRLLDSKREHCVSLPLLLISFLLNIHCSFLLYALLRMFVNLLRVTWQYLHVKKFDSRVEMHLQLQQCYFTGFNHDLASRWAGRVK